MTSRWEIIFFSVSSENMKGLFHINASMLPHRAANIIQRFGRHFPTRAHTHTHTHTHTNTTSTFMTRGMEEIRFHWVNPLFNKWLEFCFKLPNFVSKNFLSFLFFAYIRSNPSRDYDPSVHKIILAFIKAISNAHKCSQKGFRVPKNDVL